VAQSEGEAIQELKGWYAQELGTVL